MIVEDDIIYPHLAKFQMRLSKQYREIRTDRELREEFGKIEELEDEEIWRMENENRR